MPEQGRHVAGVGVRTPWNIASPAVRVTMSAQDTINDLTAGTIGGAAGIIAGQPFDTIKVRMQSRGHLYRSTWDCFRSTVRDEGVRGLYKGMASPLVGNAPMNALLFAGYRGTLRLLDPDADPVVGCPASHIYTAGIVAGVLQCVIIAPADLIKCQMQVQMGRKALITPLQCAKQMVAHNGWRNGLFRGWWITFLRDAPTYGLYFVSYEKMRLGMERYFPRGEDGKPSALPALLAGAWRSLCSPTLALATALTDQPAGRPCVRTLACTCRWPGGHGHVAVRVSAGRGQVHHPDHACGLPFGGEENRARVLLQLQAAWHQVLLPRLREHHAAGLPRERGDLLCV